LLRSPLDSNQWRHQWLVQDYRYTKFGPKSEKLDPTQMELALEDLETAIAETQVKIAFVEDKIAASRYTSPAARRKSLSPLFAASSERANLSSVVGVPFGWLKSRNSTFSDRPGAHLALNKHGSKFFSAVSTRSAPRNYTT
jgi:hypothetical protein